MVEKSQTNSQLSKQGHTRQVRAVYEDLLSSICLFFTFEFRLINRLQSSQNQDERKFHYETRRSNWIRKYGYGYGQ